MKTIARLLLSAAIILTTNATYAQVVNPELEARLNRTLDSMRTRIGAKSFSAAIQFADGAVWAHADGISSLSPLADVTTSDAYLIGSVTKTITSACVLQLADEGALSLDDSLHRWLDTMPYINPNITIRQLLQHTSGIYDVLTHPHNQDSLMADVSRVWTPEELIDRFIGAPLFSPGARWSYSNTNYFLLAMIIKRVTGRPFYTELRNRFYTPLLLNSFAIPAFEPLTGPVAHCWLDITGDGVLDDAHDFYMSYMSLNSTAGAAGGYFATPTDCTKWMRKYMRGDLLSAAMMTEARRTVSAPGSQGGLYGLGQMKNLTDFLGYEAYGHGGDLAYHASSWYFPVKDASITVFTNDNDKNSWALLPVVRELLRTYTTFKPTAVANINTNNIDITTNPNPFGNELNVTVNLSAPQELRIAITDVCGREVAMQHTMATAGSATYTFGNLNDLSNGVYFVTLKTNDGLGQTIKIVK